MMDAKVMVLQMKKTGSDVWVEFPFVDRMIVGSGDVDLKLDDGNLSPQHFELRENPTGIYLKDLDPAAGVTFYDSTELEADVPVILEIGQEFKAGEYTFRLVPGTAVGGFEGSDEIDLSDRKLTHQIRDAASGIGKKRIAGIVIGIVVLSITGALLIYFLGIRPSQQAAVASATQAEGTTVVSTANPTADSGIELTPTFGVDQTAVVAALDDIIQAPGEGEINVDSIELGGNGLSLNQIYQLALNPDEALSMAVELYGENVAYAYVFSGLLKDDKVMATVMDYIEADDTQIVDGVTAPDWGDNPQIPLNFEWKPFVYHLSDGKSEIVALLIPERYALSAEKIVYRAVGIYEPSDSQTRFDAYLRFDGAGNMLDMLTFGPLGSERGTPYKVEPRPGDSFVVYDQEFVIDPETESELPINISNSILSPELQLLLFSSLKDKIGYGFGKGEFLLREGGRLTFDEAPIIWSKDTNYPGDYVAGFAIQDLDNNFYVGYVPVIVDLP